MNRRTFIAGGLGGLALLAGGIYFTKGSWYRQTVNSVRNLTGDLDAQFLRHCQVNVTKVERVGGFLNTLTLKSGKNT